MRIALALLALTMGAQPLVAQRLTTAYTREDTAAAYLAYYMRIADSMRLVDAYGAEVPVGDILQEGYDLASIGKGESPEKYDDEIFLFARRSANSGWIRTKTPTGYDRGLMKVEANCAAGLLKLGQYGTFTEVAPGTVGQGILERVCASR